MQAIHRALLWASVLNAAWAGPVVYGNASTPAITPAPTTSTTTAPGLFSSGSPLACSNTAFLGAILGAYQSLSTDPVLQCECLTQLSDWLHATNPGTHTTTRSIGTGVTTITEVISGMTTTETTELVYMTTVTITGNGVYADGNNWYGSATSPCCYSCTVAAATVELFYWPTPAPSNLVTSFVSNDYTYISPSVYIGFSSLYAYDYCGKLGQVYTNTTMSFHPDELSTVQVVPTASQTVTYYTTSLSTGTGSTTDIATYYYYTTTTPAALNYEVLGQNCSTISGYTYVPGNPTAVQRLNSPDPCHPTIVVPTRVMSLQPSWETCLLNPIGGFYDPPYALQPQAALLPATTTTSAPPPATTVPAPPGSPTTVGPPPTSTPLPDLGTTSSSALPASEPTPSGVGSVPSSPGSNPPLPESSTGTGTGTKPANGAPPPQGVSTTGSPSGSSGTGVGAGTGSGSGSGLGSGSGSGTGSGTGSPVGSGTGTGGSGTGASPGSGNNGGNGAGSAPGGQSGTGSGVGSGLGTGAGTGTGAFSEVPTPVITIGTSTVAQNSNSAFVIGTATLAPGGPAVTIGKSTLSLPATGSVIVVNGVTTSITVATIAVPVSSGTASGSGSASGIGSGSGAGPGPGVGAAGTGTRTSSGTSFPFATGAASRPELTFSAGGLMAVLLFALYL